MKGGGERAICKRMCCVKDRSVQCILYVTHTFLGHTYIHSVNKSIFLTAHPLIVPQLYHTLFSTIAPKVVVDGKIGKSKTEGTKTNDTSVNLCVGSVK